MSMSYTESEAGEQQVNYLVLRQLAKDVNVRLSDPLPGSQAQGAANLLALSNTKGLAFAVTTDGFLVLQLDTLRTFFKAAARNSSPRVSEPLRTINTAAEGGAISSKATFLRIANGDANIVAGFESGAIAAWNIEGLVSGSQLEPAFVLQPPSAGLKLLDLAPNPSDRPELCAALYSQPGATGIDAGTVIVLDITKGSWGSQLNPDSGVRTSSLCWSVKGKQIALGLENGEILQITPEGEAKDRLSKPTGLDGAFFVTDIRWLENHAFIVTYNAPSSSEDELEHAYEVYAVLRDAKAKQITFAKFPVDPAPPYGDTSRKGNRYISWLKGWEPAKHLVFVGSSPSTDVGLLGCSSEGQGAEAWSVMELDETSRPILPFSSLDKFSDTAPVGLELDLTATDDIEDPNAAARGDGKDKMPAVPVLYVYTSDGVLLAYDVINTQSGPFPGMVAASSSSSQGAAVAAKAASDASAAPASASTPAASTTPSPAPAAAPLTPGTPSAFGQTSTPSAFGQTSKPSAFGQPSTPAFGQSSAFGKASPFGAPAGSPGAGTSVFGSAASGNGSGFGAFSGAGKPSAFGSTGFSFGSPSPAPSAPSTPAAAAGSTTSSDKPATSTPTFGSSSSTAPLPRPASAFGSTSAFGQAARAAAASPSAKPTFGQSSGFGSTSAFGQAPTSVFGSPSVSPFGSTPTTPAVMPEGSGGFGGFSTSTSSGGGFEGFASKSGSAFGAAPSPSSSGSVFGSGGKLETSSTPSKTFGGGSVFGGSSSAFAIVGSPSAFSTSASAFGGFGHKTSSTIATNKDAEDKEKEASGDVDEQADAVSGGGGSFSFGGLDSMLGSGEDEKEATPKPESKPTPGSEENSSADVTTPPASTQPSAFSFGNNKPATTDKSVSPSAFAGGSTSSSSTTIGNAGRATSPPVASAFSSFKPSFGADSSFGTQPFSFAGSQSNGQQKSPSPFGASNSGDKTPFASDGGAQKPVSAFAAATDGQSKDAEKEEAGEKDAGAEGKAETEATEAKAKSASLTEKLKPVETEKETPEKKPSETAETPKPAFSFAPQPKKDEPASKPAFSFAPKPSNDGDGADKPKPSFSFAPQPSTADKNNDDAKKSAFSFAPSPKAGEEAAPKSAFSFAPKPAEEKKDEQTKSPFGGFALPPPAAGDAPKPVFGLASQPAENDAVAKKDEAPAKPAFGFGQGSTPSPSLGSRPGVSADAFSFGKPAEQKDDATNKAAQGSTTPPDSPRKSAAAPSPAPTDTPVQVKEEPQSPPADLSKLPTADFSGFGKPATPQVAGKEQAQSAKPAAKPLSPFGSFGQQAPPQQQRGFSFGKSAEPSKPESPQTKPSAAPPPAASADPVGSSGKAQQQQQQQQNQNQNQSFFAFNSRAPRSSSPLTGTPMTNADLSESPEKAKAGGLKPSFSFNKFAPKPAAPSPLTQPSFGGFGKAPVAGADTKQQQSGSTTAKPSFSFAPSPAQQPPAAQPAQPAFGGAGAGAGMFGKPAGGSAAEASSPLAPQAVASKSPAPPPPVTTAPSAVQPPAAASAARGPSPLVSGQAPQLGGAVSALDPNEVTEKGIQGEFLKAYLVLTKELGVLRSNVNQCAAFLAQLRQPTGLPETTADFGDPSKWSFGDLQKMLQLTQSLENETGKLEDKSTGQKRQLTELQSLQLKAEAKREELARFIRARSDPEFAKIVRVRQLGPEHVENQNRLRKTSQLVRDRMQELDEYLAVLKNRITNEKLGRSTLKAPTLDSVARATRNITAMASDCVLELDHLALQLDMLTVRSGSVAGSRRQRDSRSTSVSSRRFARTQSPAMNATPFDSVGSLADSLPCAGSGAAATASASRAASAALRAERTKREAKDIFIAARAEPLLNRSAVPTEQKRRAPTKTFESSDLQIAFARGPVHFTQRPPPAVPAAVVAVAANLAAASLSPSADTSNKPRFAPPSPAKPLNAYPSPKASPASLAPASLQQQQQQQPLAGFGGFGSSLTPLSFGPPPSGALFDLPADEKPFMPGGRPNDAGATARAHHASKSKPRSNIAVSLPPTASPGSPGGGDSSPAKVSDFFAAPPSAGSSPVTTSAPVKPPVFSGFKNVGGGFGSFGASSSTPSKTPSGSAPSFSFGKPSASPSSSSLVTTKLGGSGSGVASGFSFAPPNRQEPVTFDGLQQPKPLFGAKAAASKEAEGSTSFGSGDGSEDFEEDKDEEDYEDEDDYENEEEEEEDEYGEDDDEEGEEGEGEVVEAAEEEEGLSAVEEEGDEIE